MTRPWSSSVLKAQPNTSMPPFMASNNSTCPCLLPGSISTNPSEPDMALLVEASPTTHPCNFTNYAWGVMVMSKSPLQPHHTSPFELGPSLTEALIVALAAQPCNFMSSAWGAMVMWTTPPHKSMNPMMVKYKMGKTLTTLP